MKQHIASLLVTTATVCTLAANPAHAELGDDVAVRLKNLYDDTRQDCGRPSMPAFLCSGVTFRAIWPSTDYPFWSVSPKSRESGGVSASYLRRDAKFKRLAWGLKSGFIFDTIIGNPKHHVDYAVLCAFPIDAGTDARTQQGCADSSKTPGNTEKLCHEENVTTAEQWLVHYTAKERDHSMQCGFDVSDKRNEKGAPAFYQSIRAMGMIADESFTTQNELRIAAWKDTPPTEPSILAAFYTDKSGRDHARLYQAQWWANTHKQLPMIYMRLPETPAQDVSFSFDRQEQLIYPTTAGNVCARYVESAVWTKSFDPGLKKDVWSLSVTPTECGRKTDRTQTNNFFNELATYHWMPPEWQGNTDNPESNIASMRRQLACHLEIADTTPKWTLEPSRRYVTQEESKAQRCDNF